MNTSPRPGGNANARGVLEVLRAGDVFVGESEGREGKGVELGKDRTLAAIGLMVLKTWGWSQRRRRRKGARPVGRTMAHGLKSSSKGSAEEKKKRNWASDCLAFPGPNKDPFIFTQARGQ
jgi:hypothetical protein